MARAKTKRPSNIRTPSKRAAPAARKPTPARKARTEPNKAGRPPKITADAQTLNVIRNAAALQCTQENLAALLGVAPSTAKAFLRANPAARKAWDEGIENGLVSIRRSQFKMADKNPAMAIWLGKQYLGQREPAATVALTGPKGGPVETIDPNFAKLAAALDAATAARTSGIDEPRRVDRNGKADPAPAKQ